MGHWHKALIKDFWQAKNEKHSKEFNAVEILDAKYEVPDLMDVADSQTHLDLEERTELKQLLFEFQDIFQYCPGKWQGKPVHINLKKDARPIYSCPYHIPQTYYAKFCKEINHFVYLKVSKWRSPNFASPRSIIIISTSPMIYAASISKSAASPTQSPA